MIWMFSEIYLQNNNRIWRIRRKKNKENLCETKNKTKKQFAILFSVFFCCMCVYSNITICLFVGGWLVGWLDFMLEIWLESHPVRIFFLHTHTHTHTNENCIYWNQSINQSELLLLLSSSFDYYCKKNWSSYLFVSIFEPANMFFIWIRTKQSITLINASIDQLFVFFFCFCFCVVFFVFFSNVKIIIIIIIIVIINEWMNEKIFFFFDNNLLLYVKKKKIIYTRNLCGPAIRWWWPLIIISFTWWPVAKLWPLPGCDCVSWWWWWWCDGGGGGGGWGWGCDCGWLWWLLLVVIVVKPFVTAAAAAAAAALPFEAAAAAAAAADANIWLGKNGKQ